MNFIKNLLKKKTNESTIVVTKAQLQNLVSKGSPIIDAKINGFVIGKPLARKAKFTILVETRSKRVLRVYDMSEAKAHHDYDTARVTFENQIITYRDDVENDKSIILPELKNWNRMNPALDLKKYMNNHNLSDSDELKALIPNSEKLKDSDILLVRTYVH